MKRKIRLTYDLALCLLTSLSFYWNFGSSLIIYILSYIPLSIFNFISFIYDVPSGKTLPAWPYFAASNCYLLTSTILISYLLSGGNALSLDFPIIMGLGVVPLINIAYWFIFFDNRKFKAFELILSAVLPFVTILIPAFALSFWTGSFFSGFKFFFQYAPFYLITIVIGVCLYFLSRLVHKTISRESNLLCLNFRGVQAF